MPKAEPFIQVEPINFDKLSKRFDGSREYMLASLNSTLRDVGKLLTPQVKDKTPVGATKDLRNKTVFQVLGRAEDMRLEVRQSAFSKKGFPYGAAVRHGTKPHFPPIDALVPWVRKKLGLAGVEARGVAFLIARKISKYGTKPNPYHIEVFEANQGKVKDMMKDAAVDFCVELSNIPEVRL